MNDIEIVDEFEIYLLDGDGNRIKKICGRKHKDKICKQSSGHKTQHVGWGRCSLHEDKGAGRLYMSYQKMMKKLEDKGIKIFVDIEKAMEVAGEIDLDMEDMQEDAKFLYAMLMMYVGDSDENKEFDKSDIHNILNVLREIKNMKESQHKIKRDSNIDIKQLMAFVNGIFTVIARTVPDAALVRQVIENIQSDVILPLGRASGSKGKYLVDNVDKEGQDAIIGAVSNKIEDGDFTEEDKE